MRLPPIVDALTGRPVLTVGDEGWLHTPRRHGELPPGTRHGAQSTSTQRPCARSGLSMSSQLLRLAPDRRDRSDEFLRPHFRSAGRSRWRACSPAPPCWRSRCAVVFHARAHTRAGRSPVDRSEIRADTIGLVSGCIDPLRRSEDRRRNPRGASGRPAHSIAATIYTRDPTGRSRPTARDAGESEVPGAALIANGPKAQFVRERRSRDTAPSTFRTHGSVSSRWNRNLRRTCRSEIWVAYSRRSVRAHSLHRDRDGCWPFGSSVS